MRDLMKIWKESGLPMTEENIRSVFKKSDGYRVFRNYYESTITPFIGHGRAGITFVLSGSCVYRTDVEVTVTAPEVVFLREGACHVTILNNEELHFVSVCDLNAIVEADAARKLNDAQ